jgi:phosphate starvation-inducible PhoH-like protein
MSSSTLHYPSARHLSQLYSGREENLSAAERLLAVKIITR